MGLPQTGQREAARWDPQFFLLLHHPADSHFVVVGSLTAGLAALEQPVIALGVKKAFFVKTGLLELVIYVGGQNEIVPSLQSCKSSR